VSARLTIVRHGNTFDAGDVVRRVGGRTDLALSQSGRAQAQALARHFAGHGPDFTLARTGPLLRTRQTAEAILAAQASPPPLEADLFLREIDYGPDENQPEEAVLARLGHAALEAWEREGRPPADWRVDPDAVIANWQLLFEEARKAGGEWLVVTSNGIARFARAACGAETAGGKLRTAAWGVIELTADTSKVLEWDCRPA
jgi:broad specificity phosphatase PhoE